MKSNVRPTPRCTPRLAGRLDANFTGKVVSDLRRRNAGIRFQHWVNRNSIKL